MIIAKIDCPWCEGAGYQPCDAPWCADMSHNGTCPFCLGDGSVPAKFRPETARWLIHCPVWAVPHVRV